MEETLPNKEISNEYLFYLRKYVPDYSEIMSEINEGEQIEFSAETMQLINETLKKLEDAQQLATETQE